MAVDFLVSDQKGSSSKSAPVHTDIQDFDLISDMINFFKFLENKEKLYKSNCNRFNSLKKCNIFNNNTSLSFLNF